MDEGYIEIKRARVNNLKEISLKIPRGKLVVITGVSGSGKSSLAFDTLFAEGQRRFAESISAFARQFLGRMSKPDVDLIAGIPPAIAISQKVSTHNPRSTVGSSTEIYDYLRILFARIGRTYSPISGKEVHCDTAKSVTDALLANAPDDGTQREYVLILAKLEMNSDNAVETLLGLKEEGFTRLCSRSGELVRIEEYLSSPEAYDASQMLLMVDRIRPNDDDDTRSRVLDSVQTAFKRGNGYIYIFSEGEIHPYSNIFEADGMRFEEPSEYLFSYNNPIGACKVCGGFGKITDIDEALVVPDPNRSVYDDCIACWRGEVMSTFKNDLVLNASKFDFPIHTPYRELTKDQKNLLWDGNEYFTGIGPFFKWVESQKYKIQYRYMFARYSGKTTCRACEGSRLRPEALYVKVGGRNIHELMTMPIRELSDFFDSLELSPYEKKVAERPLKEIRQRLDCINSVGLSYLTLNRASNTLSGGESQRINLVSSLGNNLVGSMYILDEPSIGLHSRDTERLIEVLKRLRDLGNTVIVVEHDEAIIRAADTIIDIGPGAGRLGGEVVFNGTIGEASALPEGKSITADYLTGRKKITIPEKQRTWKYSVEVIGALENNLKSIDVKFPLNCITAVTGVSGSGKSSLVGDILYPAIYRAINQMGDKPGLHREIRGDLKRITEIEYVDQNPIGKSTRSNPVTYLKIYDEIRNLFADQPYARMNGYGHSHFSFNIDGGRCPECQGEGVINIGMQFMADVKMVCETCGGKRFKPDILEVKYRGKDINDVLSMSVAEAIEFFGKDSDPIALRIAQKLQPLMDVGLSYVSLGQSSSTLSGGESQRIKLASYLSRETASGESVLFIFDEPTTGLHWSDIEKLLMAFNALVNRGHSIIVIEHNLDVIRSADWVIELGPDAGDKGGEVIFTGTPQELALHKEIPTGRVI